MPARKGEKEKDRGEDDFRRRTLREGTIQVSRPPMLFIESVGKGEGERETARRAEGGRDWGGSSRAKGEGGLRKEKGKKEGRIPSCVTTARSLSRCQEEKESTVGKKESCSLRKEKGGRVHGTKRGGWPESETTVLFRGSSGREKELGKTRRLCKGYKRGETDTAVRGPSFALHSKRTVGKGGGRETIWALFGKKESRKRKGGRECQKQTAGRLLIISTQRAAGGGPRPESEGGGRTGPERLSVKEKKIHKSP